MAEKNSKTKNAESTPKATGTKTTTSKDTTAKKAESSAKATTSAKSTTAKASATKAESTKATSSKATAEKAETKKTATAEKTTSNSKVTNVSKTTTANKSTKATTATTKAVTKATATKETAKVASSTKSSIAKENKAETKDIDNVATKNSSANKKEPKSANTKVEAKATENKTATKTSAKTSNKVDSKADTNVTSKSSTKSNTKADLKTAEQPKATTAKVEQKNTAKAENKAVANKATTNSADTKTTKKIADKAQTKEAENSSAKEEIVASKAEDNKAEKSKFDFSAMFAFGKKNNTENNAETNVKKPKANNNNKQDNQKVSFKDKMVAMAAGKNKQENTSTATKAVSNSNGQGKTTFVDFFKGNKIRLFAIIALALFLMFIFILSISLGVVNANKNKLPSNSSQSIKSDSITTGSTYDYEYRTTATAGYNAEILGYVDRKIPTEVSYESASGLAEKYYPKYGHTPQGMSDASLRQKLVNEAIKLCTINTRIGSDGYPPNTYDKMDKDGNLYLNGQRVTGSPNKLYKHISSVGMYYGDISNDEKAVIKKMTFNPRSFHTQEMYNVTGLYAPAGEVIKVEISKEDMERTGGVLIHIGQALYNRKANNIWVAKGQMQRFPVILNSMMITKNTAEYIAEKDVYVGYIGSFLGGPIYVTNSNASLHRITTSFSMTISGGVTYSHFILGHTTPEEFDANKDSTVPYFDLEVWDNGVLHSGPKMYAQNYSYDDLYKVAVLWDKITSVTTYGYNQNIVFLYDPFVAAGAAVAFPTQGAVNCPGSWMANALNYEGLRKSGGWGNLHEYHHNFQGYGVGAGGEVTNNALTLVSYALFTQISSSRQMGNFGATGLGGWNRYTVATWALEQVKRIQNPNQNPENGNKGLSLYATLLHNFGPDAFMQVRKLGGGQSYQNYFKKWEQVTHYNMTYYFSEMLRANEVQPGTITDEWLKANSNPNYPMFVPVSSVYQTGRGYNYDNVNKFNKTMQPYVIAYGQDFTIDLSPYTLLADGNHKSGSIVLPEGFSYKVKSITQPENGVITRIGNDNYLYNLSPNDKLMTGEIYVTLEITKDDNAFVVEDVDLILEFEQSHELTGRMLERTTYNFDGETKYTSAYEAFTKGYAGNTGVIKGDNKNPTQNSNTDIWMTADQAKEANSHNSVMEVKGKFLISESGKYRFQIRGRYNVALFLAVNEIPEKNSDFKHYCEYTNNSGGSANFPTENNEQVEGTYIELDLKYGDWVYLRAVMVSITTSKQRTSFIGVGMGKVPDPMPQVDDNGNPLLDSDGNPLPDIQNPTTISYATAYRESYQPAENHFNPEYYYTKNLVYSYKETNQQVIDTKQTIVETNYKPHNANSNKIENLVDGDKNTYIFTTNNSFSETNPLYFVAKFDQPITASVFTIHLRKSTNGHQRPKKLKLYISSNGTDWDLIVNTRASDNLPQSLQQFEFNKLYTFQYYKLAIESSFNNYDIFITELEFTYKFLLNNGTQLALGDKDLKLTGSWDIQNVISKFGRVYVGKTNSAIQFEFTGNRLLLLSVLENNNFEVYIDGKKVNSMDFEKTDTAYKPSYISPELEIKTHSVIIKCLGESNFESIVIYKS